MAGGRNPESERRYRAEVARFLQGVRDAAGYPSDAELARDLKVPPSSISHWFSETSKRGVSAYNVVQVIRAAEARAPGSTGLPVARGDIATAAGGSAQSAPDLSVLLAALQATVAKNQETMEALEKRLAALERADKGAQTRQGAGARKPQARRAKASG